MGGNPRWIIVWCWLPREGRGGGCACRKEISARKGERLHWLVGNFFFIDADEKAFFKSPPFSDLFPLFPLPALLLPSFFLSVQWAVFSIAPETWVGCSKKHTTGIRTTRCSSSSTSRRRRRGKEEESRHFLIARRGGGGVLGRKEISKILSDVVPIDCTYVR